MEKMNHLKRVMAWVMTAAMLVSSCPTTAIADEVVSQVQKPVAQTLRSGETYGSLQEAYKAEFETTTDFPHSVVVLLRIACRTPTTIFPNPKVR